MQWIKSHLSVVIAGAVSLLALVAIGLGVFLSDAASAMSQDVSVYSGLSGVNGASKRVFDDLRKRQLDDREVLSRERSKVIGKEEPKPLAPAAAIFPEPDPNQKQAPYQFKSAFRAKLQEFLTLLNAKDQPTPDEVQEEADKMLRLKGQQEFNRAAGGRPGAARPGAAADAATPGAVPDTAAAPEGASGFGFGAAAGGFGVRPGGLNKPRADMTPEDRLREDPNARASVAKAHRLWCYASLDSFDPRPAILGADVQQPKLNEMWYAQKALWIQEDIVGALARLNAARAEQLPEKDRWVGNMPVKHLISINIGGYVPEGAAAGGPGASAAAAIAGMSGGPPPMDAQSVMTKRGTRTPVDVIQFTMELVVEARSLPLVIDEICKSGFYTVLQTSYEAVPPNPEMVGYIYGSQPASKVWLLMEGCYLRDKYEKLMPKSVVAEIDEKRPVGGGGGGATASGGGMNIRMGGPTAAPMPAGPGGSNRRHR